MTDFAKGLPIVADFHHRFRDESRGNLWVVIL